MAADSKSEERREPTMDAPRSPAKSKKKKGKAKPKSGSGRSLIGRVAYWSVVLGLWCFIGAIGVIGWVAAHLPPIQSLEVPKRPPSIQIVGLNGRVLATRGEMGGSAVPLRELAAASAEGVPGDRGPPLLFALGHRRVRRHARGLGATSCIAASRRAARRSRSSSRRTSSSRRSAP